MESKCRETVFTQKDIFKSTASNYKLRGKRSQTQINNMNDNSSFHKKNSEAGLFSHQKKKFLQKCETDIFSVKPQIQVMKNSKSELNFKPLQNKQNQLSTSRSQSSIQSNHSFISQSKQQQSSSSNIQNKQLKNTRKVEQQSAFSLKNYENFIKKQQQCQKNNNIQQQQNTIFKRKKDLTKLINDDNDSFSTGNLSNKKQQQQWHRNRSHQTFYHEYPSKNKDFSDNKIRSQSYSDMKGNFFINNDHSQNSAVKLRKQPYLQSDNMKLSIQQLNPQNIEINIQNQLNNINNQKQRIITPVQTNPIRKNNVYRHSINSQHRNHNNISNNQNSFLTYQNVDKTLNFTQNDIQIQDFYHINSSLKKNFNNVNTPISNNNNKNNLSNLDKSNIQTNMKNSFQNSKNSTLQKYGGQNLQQQTLKDRIYDKIAQDRKIKLKN